MALSYISSAISVAEKYFCLRRRFFITTLYGPDEKYIEAQ